jgi:hypothetical protein
MKKVIIFPVLAQNYKTKQKQTPWPESAGEPPLFGEIKANFCGEKVLHG